MDNHNRIGALRKSRKISQQVLGDCLGISQQNVSRIESQPVPEVSSDLLCRIADYFQVSVDYLLNREEDDGERDSVYPVTDPLQIYKKLSPEDRKLWINVGARMVDYSDGDKIGLLARKRK